MKILVYRYGLLAPTEEGPRVAEQISLAHRYQNKLIEIERDARERREAVIRTVPEVAAIEARVAEAEAALAAARDVLKAENSAARSVGAGDPTHAKNLHANLKGLWAARKAARRQALAQPTVVASLSEEDERRKTEIRAARGECGVFWGTYLQIEAAVEQARRSPAPPRFQPWNGEGSVSVQLMKGLRVGEDLIADRRFQITPVATPVPGRGGKPLPRVRLRIGSVGRDPIFAEWPLILHRPLPENAVIKWAKVVRRRIGAHPHWSLHLTLEIPGTDQPAATDAKANALAVNLRWSKAGAPETTVAEFTSANGSGSLVADAAIDSMLQKSNDLRSIRDKNFERAKAALIERKQTLALPDSHKERLQHLHAWRACGKLAAFVLWWRENRVEGDAEAFGAAETWRKQDKHLWDWEANARRKAIARRRDAYRVFAAKAARDYDVLVIEKLNIAKLAAKPAPEESREVNPVASSQRVSASPSELRGALVNAFKRVGKRIVEVEPGVSSVEMLSRFQSGGGAEVALVHGPSKRSINLRKRKTSEVPVPDPASGEVIL